MKDKELDLNKTLYDLTKEYPELIDILFELGFSGVKNPITRNTHGKIMTIVEGSKFLGIDLNKIIETLKEKGFNPKV